MSRRLSLMLLTAAALAPAPALAAEESFELWFSPRVKVDLDADTTLEVETAQRFRGAASGPDTYFARLVLMQAIDDKFAIGGGVQQLVNDGAGDETRLLQQVSAKTGVLRARLRLEQRFVDDADQTGWRIRPRLGVSVPLDPAKRWRLAADVEPFFTLRPTGNGGQTGLTTLRTQVGVNHAVTERLELGLTYLRNQDIRDGATDRVAHVPLIGLEYSF